MQEGDRVKFSKFGRKKNGLIKARNKGGLYLILVDGTDDHIEKIAKRHLKVL